MKQWHSIPLLAAAVPLALAMSVPAQAQSADGYLNGDIALRAGPALEFPEIEGLPYGTYVSVQGCTEDWVWCDVIAGPGDRGWVPGDYIDYVYEGEPVVVTEYGPRIGIPIVTFSITNYWNAHYHDRPFYRERSVWFHRDIPRHAPAPPHHVAHRKPPPPPPGGWHHGGHASQSRSHGNAAAPRHHENASSPAGHESRPSPQRAPVNEPEHPRGDHHANIPTPPPMGAQPQGEKAHAPPHSRAAKHKYPASNSSQGKGARKQKHKKDDHDDGHDNGH
jgi:uncharacterized protein YraI